MAKYLKGNEEPGQFGQLPVASRKRGLQFAVDARRPQPWKNTPNSRKFARFEAARRNAPCQPRIKPPRHSGNRNIPAQQLNELVKPKSKRIMVGRCRAKRWNRAAAAREMDQQ